jgi:hypothetical protein
MFLVCRFAVVSAHEVYFYNLLTITERLADKLLTPLPYLSFSTSRRDLSGINLRW